MNLGTAIGNMLFVFVIMLVSRLVLSIIFTGTLLGSAPIMNLVIMAILSILLGYLIHYLHGISGRTFKD